MVRPDGALLFELPLEAWRFEGCEDWCELPDEFELCDCRWDSCEGLSDFWACRMKQPASSRKTGKETFSIVERRICTPARRAVS